MTFALAFAIVQWGVVLPVQVYFVWRSWRNWKASEQDMIETQENLQRSRALIWEVTEWTNLQGLDDGAGTWTRPMLQ